MQKIIFISPIFNYPPAGGPELRIFNSLVSLSSIAEVHIVLLTHYKDKGKKINRRYAKMFNNKQNIFPYNLPRIIRKITEVVGKCSSKKWKEILCNIQARQLLSYAIKKNINVLWFGFGNISFELINEVRKLNPEIKIVCDTDSVWSRFVLRRIKFEKNSEMIPLIKDEGRRKKIEEKKLTSLCDIVTAVSIVDKKYYEKLSKNKKKVKLFSNVINTVDYKRSPKAPDIPKGDYIYLSGTFGFRSPMEDASIWLIEKVFPLVKLHIPDIKLLIVGRAADIVLSRYANKKNLFVKGYVRSTIPYLKGAKVSVVPLRYESGTRFKILEAGICLIPVVSTKLGAEGIDVTNGYNIKIADSPVKFAQSIIEIIEDPAIASSQSKNLFQLIKNNYSTQSLSRQGRDILDLLKEKSKKSSNIDRKELIP